MASTSPTMRSKRLSIARQAWAPAVDAAVSDRRRRTHRSCQALVPIPLSARPMSTTMRPCVPGGWALSQARKASIRAIRSRAIRPKLKTGADWGARCTFVAYRQCKLAPQAGFVHARGEQREPRRELETAWGANLRMPDRASSLVEPADFRPSPCAAACRRLLRFGAAKGQKKGNARRFSTQMAPIEFWRSTSSWSRSTACSPPHRWTLAVTRRPAPREGAKFKVRLP